MNTILVERMNRRLSQLDLSLVELSERTGESYRNVHRWLRESIKMPAHFLSRFATVVPVDARWLLTGEGTPEPFMTRSPDREPVDSLSLDSDAA